MTLTLTMAIAKPEPKPTLTLTIAILKVVFPCTAIYMQGLRLKRH